MRKNTRKITAIALFGIGLILSSCGSNTHATGNINGLWSAALSSSGAETFKFMTDITVNADGSLGSSSFNITLNNTPCTFPSTTESGSFTISGNFNGQVSGTFQYIITSTGAEVNTLILDGTVTNGVITGTWKVSGATSNCTGSGTFTMSPVLVPAQH